MQIIANNGQCEAVHAKVQNGELVIEQGPDVIVIPKRLADSLCQGLIAVVEASKPAKRKAHDENAAA